MILTAVKHHASLIDLAAAGSVLTSTTQICLFCSCKDLMHELIVIDFNFFSFSLQNIRPVPNLLIDFFCYKQNISYRISSSVVWILNGAHFMIYFRSMHLIGLRLANFFSEFLFKLLLFNFSIQLVLLFKNWFEILQNLRNLIWKEISFLTSGEDGVTLESVVRFIKLAFCYDMWNIFDAMLDCTLIYIKVWNVLNELLYNLIKLRKILKFSSLNIKIFV